jgi:hypothetical protein
MVSPVEMNLKRILKKTEEEFGQELDQLVQDAKTCKETEREETELGVGELATVALYSLLGVYLEAETLVYCLDIMPTARANLIAHDAAELVYKAMFCRFAPLPNNYQEFQSVIADSVDQVLLHESPPECGAV